MSNIDWSKLKTKDSILAEYKESAVQKINQIRDEQINAGVTYNGTVFQTRPGDRENISGAVQLATIATSQGQDFQTNWIATDNTEHTFNATQMIELGAAVAELKEHWIFAAKSQKDAIRAATTKEAVDLLLTWPQP